jgi:hypothetical protein
LKKCEVAPPVRLTTGRDNDKDASASAERRCEDRRRSADLDNTEATQRIDARNLLGCLFALCSPKSDRALGIVLWLSAARANGTV